MRWCGGRSTCSTIIAGAPSTFQVASVLFSFSHFFSGRGRGYCSCFAFSFSLSANRSSSSSSSSGGDGSLLRTSTSRFRQDFSDKRFFEPLEGHLEKFNFKSLIIDRLITERPEKKGPRQSLGHINCRQHSARH